MNKQEQIKEAIIEAHEAETGVLEAEKKAALCIDAMDDLVTTIYAADIDARTRRTGVKRIRAQALLDEVAKHEKKPTEAILNAMVELNPEVIKSEDAWIESEAFVAQLRGRYDTTKEASFHFRSIMKAGFGGQ